MISMIKVRLNSAAQITKETLQSQLKQLNCTYTVSNDGKQIVFQCPNTTNPIIGLVLLLFIHNCLFEVIYTRVTTRVEAAVISTDR